MPEDSQEGSEELSQGVRFLLDFPGKEFYVVIQVAHEHRVQNEHDVVYQAD